MTKNTLIISAALVGLAIAGALVVLFIPVTTSSPKAVSQEKAAQTSASSSGSNFDFGSAPSGDTAAKVSAAASATPSTASTNPSTSPKEQMLATIQDAMTTWSAEGVPVLQPMLSNPDREIREAAVEAMKQLGVPEAVVALRTAARKTSDPEERQAMLDAAAWAELPPLIGPGSQR